MRISLPWMLVLVGYMTAFSVRAGATGTNDLEGISPGSDAPAVVEDNENDVAQDIDDYLSGFDEPDDRAAVSTTTMKENRRWRFTGDVNLITTYNYAHSKPAPGETDYRGVSQLKVQFRPELWFDIAPGWDAKVSGSTYYDFIYRINGRNNYTHEVLNDYENDTEFRETFIRGKINPRLDLKVGRQIVVWGKSDNFRVVDVINPLDLREPGLVDIENLRLPSCMSRLDYYWGDWSLSGIAIHEIRFDKLPPYGSDFYPFPVKLPPVNTPGDGGSNTEFALSLSGIMQGWDLSLHLARLFNDNSHLEVKPQGASLQHSRLTMAGLATNIATGDWLWKAEAAYFDGLEFFSVPDKEFERTDLMAGIEYNGFDNTTLSLESVVRHIHDFDQLLKNDPVPAERNRVQTAFRYNADFLHNRLNVLLLDMRHGQTLSDGGFTRLQFKYELKEALFTTVGVVSYHRGDTVPYAEIADNDRLFVEIDYSF